MSNNGRCVALLIKELHADIENMRKIARFSTALQSRTSSVGGDDDGGASVARGSLAVSRAVLLLRRLRSQRAVADGGGGSPLHKKICEQSRQRYSFEYYVETSAVSEMKLTANERYLRGSFLDVCHFVESGLVWMKNW